MLFATDRGHHAEHIAGSYRAVRDVVCVTFDDHSVGHSPDDTMDDEMTFSRVTAGDHVPQSRLPSVAGNDGDHVPVANERVHAHAASPEAEGNTATEHGAEELLQRGAGEREDAPFDGVERRLVFSSWQR
jgi:hypothetical protein